jgi:hypothetical protein
VASAALVGVMGILAGRCLIGALVGRPVPGAPHDLGYRDMFLSARGGPRALPKRAMPRDGDLFFQFSP